MITINFEVYTTLNGTVHGEFYRFKTRSDAKAYLTRVFNSTYGKGAWSHSRPVLFYEE